MNEKSFTNLLAFWRAVEVLSPQQIPKIPSSKGNNAQTYNWGRDTNPPWLQICRRLDPSKAWRHNVHAAIFEQSRYFELLERIFDTHPDGFEERPTGQSCVFYLAFDEHGRPLAETLMISMAAWAYGAIQAHGLDSLDNGHIRKSTGLQVGAKLNVPFSNSGFSDFDTLLSQLRLELALRLEQLPNGHPVDQFWFDDFTKLIINKLKLTDLVRINLEHRVASVQVTRPKNGVTNPKTKTYDDDFLNSFFIKDLNSLLYNGLAKSNKALLRYLKPPPGMKRLDVRQERARSLEILNPLNTPVGCWPSEHPLVWSQQTAINAIWHRLGQSEGIFAVNGPPGTGKTTLLRDIVAAVIVERAKVLANHGENLLGQKRSPLIDGKYIPYYEIDSKLAGFSIVVASSNNGAVENISLELPKLDAIHGIWASEVDVYSDLAGELLNQPAWAMISGKLGNKENRSKFVDVFWWQKSNQGQQVPGLRERLDDINQDVARPSMPWQEAVNKFNESLAKENECRKRISEIALLPKTMAGLNSEFAEITEKHERAASERLKLQNRLENITADLERTTENMTLLNRRVNRLLAGKPGFLEWLSTFGKSHRQWRQEFRSVSKELEVFEGNKSTLITVLDNARKTEARIVELLTDLSSKLNELNALITNLEMELSSAREMLGLHWPDLSVTGPVQERMSPWAYPEWREARIRIFITALNLHRAFIEANAKRISANIGFAMDMLRGNIPDPKLRMISLESLALVCPVISTTFASVTSLFGDIASETIGWLLIEEAGQATPQAAVGAIRRAKRVVVVGDPMQLEPVVTLPRSIEAALANYYGGIDSRWLPSCTSAQMLADRATPIGTTLHKGDGGIWVGAPLRVHRRCDDPMFSISNEIAYDGLMVHHKKNISVPWPESTWIDVPKSINNGNWIPAEGEALRTLLNNLLRNHHVPAADIFLISPFRDVVRELMKIGDNHGLDKNRVGTIHTTQGKEANVVIMVLGGGSGGARNWVASKPNLLNVAVSRAKTRFYVIGDRTDWSKQKYFDVLDNRLSAGV